MLQRINLVLMIVVLIVVGLVSLQMYITQKTLTADLAQMRKEANSSGVVYLAGDVLRPGVFSLPKDGLRLSRFFAAAGELTGLPVLVEVKRTEDGKDVVVVQKTISSSDELGDHDIELQPDDLITVTAPEQTRTSPRAPWRTAGAPIANSPNDAMS